MEGGLSVSRQSLRATGVVQGVGFRPFVFQLAQRLSLSGFVRNELGAVLIEVEGPPERLDDFARRLVREAPALARIDALQTEACPPHGERGFRIAPSADAGAPEIALPADLAPCDDCLRELFDPSARRYHYPFLNCTACGPRLTVIEALPYDRRRTTLRDFPMCGDCRREYEDPASRWFHAEPTACPRCGPALSVIGEKPGDPADPIACAVLRLVRGEILAIKGAGGFHLACDAANPTAVAALRSRKRRDEQPFALMVADLRAARALCEVEPAAAVALESPARPIVLLPARLDAQVAPGVAPGSRLLGVMLPATPLHHLLMREAGRPLVMTSGNISGEPIAFQDADARERLGPIADLFLTHDRPIRARCDDSVCRPIAGRVIPFRRSRGHAPLPTRLPSRLGEPTLAVGGMFKSTFALGEGTRAVASHHLGDLDHPEAFRAFRAATAHYEEVFRFSPRRIAHDLHPDYPSTAWAQSVPGVRLVAVQHHHAHFASALLDAGIQGPAVGVVFDGAGYGTDGAIWGGEFLVGDARAVDRRAHLPCIGLAGGDRAAREPWRVAIAYLTAAGLPLDPAERRIGADRVHAVASMLPRSTPTSSVGRLFDAVAWLLGGPDVQTFEGQAAMGLEALASSSDDSASFSFAGLDPAPAIRQLFQTPPAIAARRFHRGLAEATARQCRLIADETGLADVVLTGGVFQNALLTELTSAELVRLRLRPHIHRHLPPNDAGLALGQLAVAAALDRES